MEYDQIKKLIEDMGSSKLTELDINFPDGTKISMKKDAPQVVTSLKEVKLENGEATKTEAGNEVVKEETSKKGNVVKSPMVGTFYIKPSPTSQSYVEVGKDVKVGDTLCIIEAMKLMNEIESEYAGKVAEILVKDGDVVEYGTPLFRIE